MISNRTSLRTTTLLLATVSLLVSPICAEQASAQQRQRQTTKGAPSAISVQQADPEVVELAGTFGALAHEEFVNWLTGVQHRNPPSVASRRQWISSYLQQSKLSVVKNGDTLFRISERARPALQLFRREGIITFIVFVCAEPYIESRSGTCISMTSGLLKLIENDAQLNALISHELAHEMNDEAYARAARERDLKRMRSYELSCDAVAALALKAKGMEPRELGRILFKTISWDESTMTANDGRSKHPSLASRLRLNELLAKALVNQAAETKYPPVEN